MSDAAQINQEDGASAFMRRLACQPHASFTGVATGRNRDDAIDIFLTALSDGDGEYTAAIKAGVTVDLLSAWAQDKTEYGNIFAMQWRHAEMYAKEQNTAKMRELSYNGCDEYIPTKDGVATWRDPVTGNTKPLIQRRYHADLIKFFLTADNPARFGKRAVDDAAASIQLITQNDIAKDRPTIAPDEPGPANPVP